jgi:hypothetical protein
MQAFNPPDCFMIRNLIEIAMSEFSKKKLVIYKSIRPRIDFMVMNTIAEVSCKHLMLPSA